MTPTPTPQEVQDLIAKVKALPAADANGHHTLRAAAAALSAYQQEVETLRERVAPLDEGPVCLLADYQAMRDRAEAAEAEVERLTKERDDWKLATDQFQGMWSDAEARAADAKRAAFAEAAQYIRDLSVAAGRDTPDMQALADLVERLAAQAVPPGFCASCTPDIRPQCESASWCMRPQAVPPGATEE
jgi:chromosome segregation ATPase